jgi:signal peptidase II
MLKVKLSRFPWQWIGLSVGLATIDQITKYWALQYLTPLETVWILPGLALYLCYNMGVGFSLLSSIGGNIVLWVTILSMIRIIWITQELYRSYQIPNRSLFAWGFTLIIGGGLGNLSDRLMRGIVVDFISLRLPLKGPIFNMADVFINIGFLFILVGLHFTEDFKRILKKAF